MPRTHIDADRPPDEVGVEIDVEASVSDIVEIAVRWMETDVG